MVEEAYLPLTLSAPGLTDAQFEELCQQYADYRVEYTAEGDLVIMPPTDPETSARNSLITYQLTAWALNGPGMVTESSGGYLLPNGARLAPDAAWISRDRLRRRRSCPQFVIELLSPTDRPRKIRAKMQEWIDNGAELGWMIDPGSKTVTVFRPGREPEDLRGIAKLEGEGPVSGFVLDLRPVWT